MTQNEQATSIGQNIYRFRTAANLTQRELATKIGKSYSLIQKYEKDRALPPITVIKAIADVLNVDYYEIIGWNEIPGDDNAVVISRRATDEDPARMVTTEAEFTMLTAYRSADDRAREDALVILQAHQKR